MSDGWVRSLEAIPEVIQPAPGVVGGKETYSRG